MILSIIKINAPPGQAHTILDVLESIKGQISTNSGCLGCLLAIEVGESKIYYQEKWRNRETFDQHLRSDLYTRVLAAMELSCEHPSIEFFEVNGIGGLELVEKARNKQECQSDDVTYATKEGHPFVRCCFM